MHWIQYTPPILLLLLIALPHVYCKTQSILDNSPKINDVVFHIAYCIWQNIPRDSETKNQGWSQWPSSKGRDAFFLGHVGATCVHDICGSLTFSLVLRPFRICHGTQRKEGGHRTWFEYKKATKKSCIFEIASWLDLAERTGETLCTMFGVSLYSLNDSATLIFYQQFFFRWVFLQFVW